MRLLIFVGDRAAAEDLYWSLKPRPMISMARSEHEMRAVIDYLENNPDGIAILGPGYATGWRAPPDTRILFEGGFPDDPALRAQARGRVPLIVDMDAGRRVVSQDGEAV